MKIFVTGASGFLGTALVERLLAHGERDLRLFVRPSARRDRLMELERRYPGAKIEYRVGTLTRPEHLDGCLAGAGAVYHLAAALAGAAADLFLHTVVGSKNLLEEIVKLPPEQRPRVVLVSSFGVYGAADLPRGATLDESTPVETHPERRDLYSQAKLRQEQLFREYQRRHGFPLTVVRPGVIYGPGGTAISNRVGLNVFGVFLHLGRDNPLPLTYVDNCAEAIVLAGQDPAAVGETYNIVDDDLPACSEYLRLYRNQVRDVFSVSLPWLATLGLSHALERYHRWSRGQLPNILTPYKARAMWGGNRFDNQKLKALGWAQFVPTREGLRRTFDALVSNTPRSHGPRRKRARPV